MKKREYLCFEPSDFEVASGMVMALDHTKKWRVTIAPYIKNRTTDQNNLLWKWYTEIANHTGHTAEEIHEYCKASFLAPKFIRIGTEKFAVEYRTTTKLTTAEMSDYIERVYAWAAVELEVRLPLPEEMHMRENAP